jgi:hypothetical protein
MGLEAGAVISVSPTKSVTSVGADFPSLTFLAGG